MRTALQLQLLLLCALVASAAVCAHGERTHSGLTRKPAADVCKYICLNGGACVSGACVCPIGYVGADCAQRGCASNCNGRGYCDMSSTPVQCLCFPGFAGFECENSAAQGAALSDAAKALLAGNAVPGANITAPAAGAATLGSKQTPSRPAAVPQKGRPAVAAAAPAAASATGAAAASGAAPASNAASSAAAVHRLRKDRGLCTPECASTGLCFSGSCLCANGYTGPTCALKLCVDDCNGRGVCDQLNGGVCECYAPYTGPTCASLAAKVAPRTPDRPEDMLGGEAAQADERANNLWKDKLGLNDDFHLIERQAAAQQALLQLDQSQSQQPQTDYDYAVEYVD